MRSPGRALPLKPSWREADVSSMELLGAALSTVASLIFFTLVATCAYKAFQIATTLSEMKDLLADIKRNTNDHTPAVPVAVTPQVTPMSLDTAEHLLRAVSELDHPTPPVTVNLEHKS
jgi:type II secretory pathway component PulM